MKDSDEDFADQLGRYLVRAGLTQRELANKTRLHRNTIGKWINRTSRPEFRWQVLRLADELCLSKEERKALIQAAGFSVERWPTEVWLVPQQRDMFFVGRDDVFQSLRQLLVPGSATALTQAISGLGGIGKTNTAVEYAYRFHQYYEAVLWLQADSWEILASACMKLADELGLPGQKETDQVVEEVQRWLRNHRQWLLILDNVENPQEILPRFIPTHHQGCVLVTSRVHDVEPLAQTQVLSTMPEQEGTLFLLRRTKKIALAAGLERATAVHRDEAQQIWQLLDGLPLALDQAGAYILGTSCSFLAYRDQYTHRRAKLLDNGGEMFIGHKVPVATTFSLAFQQVEALNSVAADILRVCSLLQSEAIPEELFVEGREHLSPCLATVRESWDPAIGVLQRYSLLQRNTDAKTLTVHRLVQAVLQDAMQASEQELWTKRVITAMNRVFPEAAPATWKSCARLLPHALVCANYSVSWLQASEDLALLLYKTANYLFDRAQYREAEVLYQRALHIGEQAHGPGHSLLAFSLKGLAELRQEQGRYEEAEPLYQRALHIWEQRHGFDSPQAAHVLINLANLYAEQSRYAEAEPLYRRALHIWEQADDPDDPLVALSLNGLANLYREQGRYEEADPLYQRALHIWEQADDPDMAAPLTNLALLKVEQGRYEEAEPLYRRALYIWEQVYGPDHPLVANPLNGLALLYFRQGRYAEAEPLYQRALHIWEQAHGPDHPDVSYPLSDLANLYTEQGRYEEAEPLYRRALFIRETRLGLQHPETAEVVHSFAAFQYAQGNKYVAKTLYQRALAIREQSLGQYHAKTMETRECYYIMLRETGQQDEAILLDIPQSEQIESEEGREE